MEVEAGMQAQPHHKLFYDLFTSHADCSRHPSSFSFTQLFLISPHESILFRPSFHCVALSASMSLFSISLLAFISLSPNICEIIYFHPQVVEVWPAFARLSKINLARGEKSPERKETTFSLTFRFGKVLWITYWKARRRLRVCTLLLNFNGEKKRVLAEKSN